MKTLSLALLGSLLLAVSSSPAQTAPKRILIFGDSITWGWMPIAGGIPTGRYPTEKQWPSVAKAALGEGYEIVVDALSGRTTDLPDPSAPAQLAGPGGLNGSEVLASTIAANLPLDLVVIMLGTNDTKAQFHRTPFRIALGAGRLIDIVQHSGNMFGGGWYTYPAPKVLLLAPPPLGPQNVFAEVFKGGEETSRHWAPAYAHIAEAAGAAFLDVGSVTPTDGVDGVHFSEDAERKLGQAVAEKVKTLLP